MIKSSENVLRDCRISDLLAFRVRHYTVPKPKPTIQVRGRPRLGSYHLQTMLPAKVLDELMRAENETDVYRTRIAANVLCEWADRQALNRSGDSLHRI
jgi:hypothetical protein